MSIRPLQRLPFTEPYEDIQTKKMIVSVVAPVFEPGSQELIGATNLDVSIDGIKDIIAANKIGETGFFIVSTSSGNVFDHPNPEFNNSPLSDTDLSKNIISALMNKTAGPLSYTSGDTESQGYVTEIGDTGWILATGLPMKEFNQFYNTIQTTMLIIFSVGLLIILGLIIISTRSFIRPIVRLANVADQLALGDVDIDYTMADDGKADEIGVLTHSFVNMAENIKIQAQSAQSIAHGDLSVEIESRSGQDVLGNSMIAIKKAISNLVTDTIMLSNAAIQNDFTKRADASTHTGDYAKVISGINQTLDTVITDRDSACGMDCYNAGANICQTENCGIKRLVEQGLSDSYFEWVGRSNKQDTAYLKNKQGENIGFVEVVTDLTPIIRVRDYTQTEVMRLGDNLIRLAKGNLDFDLNIGEADEYTEEVNQQFKVIIDSLMTVKNVIDETINGASTITDAVIKGDLHPKIDTSQLNGSWKDLVQIKMRILAPTF